MQDAPACEPERIIYHLVPESELRAGIVAGDYAPRGLEVQGFIHCASGTETTLAVAGDYFGALREPLLVLEIDTQRLTRELRFEAAAPIEGGGTAHLQTALEFPHVYGPIDLAAIRGVAALGSGGNYAWPARFESLSSRLGKGPRGKFRS